MTTNVYLVKIVEIRNDDLTNITNIDIIRILSLTIHELSRYRRRRIHSFFSFAKNPEFQENLFGTYDAG